MKSLHTPHSALYFLLFLGVLTIFLLTLVTTDYFDEKPTMFTPTEDARYLQSSLSIDERVENLLSYMTLEEKIGQMTLVEKNSVKEITDIKDHALGALLSGSGSKPEDNTAAGWKTMIDTYQTEAAKSRLRIPLLYGSDAIHGHAHVSGMTIFPHMIGLGASGNPELVREVAAATAEQMAATGVNWNFAPNLDTPQDIRWGRVYETFSDDPTLVSTLGAAYVEGLQASPDTSNKNIRVLATTKHFVGLGGMQWDSSLNKDFKIDQGVTEANESLLQEVYLPPFTAAIEAGALSIMVGLNTWGDTRTVRQKYLLTDVLKQQQQFSGFVVSDWYGVHEGTRNTFLATVAAVNAGVDMVMLPFDYKTFSRHMKWANRLGLISDTRINDAVGRILYTKFALGLFDADSETESSDALDHQSHKALARDAVAQSLVLLKNQDAVLPISPTTQKIRVAGSAADNVGAQAGAWSIEWQGANSNQLANATSILAGIKETVSPTTVVEYNQQGEFIENSPLADIGIAVVGEAPYAEGWGDNQNPTLSVEDTTAIQNLRKSSKAVVVVLVTGRPLIITDESSEWDALVVAWLPGTEGAGVSDVLFGSKEFTGALPVPWPAHTDQLPISPTGITKDGSEVQFPRYYSVQ